MSKEAYCLWHDKFIVDFNEFESEICCNEFVDFCDACDLFTFRERVMFDECGTD